MTHLNIEIKARLSDPERIRQVLHAENAEFKGIDHQTDTYFRVPCGRLKLREGNIENNLIHYDREDREGPKQASVTLFHTDGSASSLKEILEKSLGILIVVDKKREIYFIGNVKFHIDVVRDLGTFVEIEAIDTDGSIGKEKLYEQCNRYLQLFGTMTADLVPVSYSDLLLSALR
jgi:adenylate cyclase, class 2